MENETEVSTVAEAFNIPDEEVSASEVKEETVAKDTAKVDETPKGEVEKVVSETEVTDEKAEVAEVTEKSWTELGLPQYETLTKEQIAERVRTTNKLYGEATNEVGTLRKQVMSVVKDEVKPADSKETKKNILEAMPNLDAGDTLKFNEMYATNPVKAIMTFGGESIIKDMVKAELDNRVPKDIDAVVNERLGAVEFNSWLKQHDLTKDHPKIEWMKVVDKEYLAGQNRSYDELFELSNMWEAKEEGVEQVYGLMKKHPTMSLKEARSFVPKKTQTVDKDKILKDVKKLTNANHTDKQVRKADDTVEVFDSVQEAFDAVSE